MLTTRKPTHKERLRLRRFDRLHNSLVSSKPSHIARSHGLISTHHHHSKWSLVQAHHHHHSRKEEQQQQQQQQLSLSQSRLHKLVELQRRDGGWDDSLKLRHILGLDDNCSSNDCAVSDAIPPGVSVDTWILALCGALLRQHDDEVALDAYERASRHLPDEDLITIARSALPPLALLSQTSSSDAGDDKITHGNGEEDKEEVVNDDMGLKEQLERHMVQKENERKQRDMWYNAVRWEQVGDARLKVGNAIDFKGGRRRAQLRAADAFSQSFPLYSKLANHLHQCNSSSLEVLAKHQHQHQYQQGEEEEKTGAQRGTSFQLDPSLGQVEATKDVLRRALLGNDDGDDDSTRRLKTKALKMRLMRHVGNLETAFHEVGDVHRVIALEKDQPMLHQPALRTKPPWEASISPTSSIADRQHRRQRLNHPKNRNKCRPRRQHPPGHSPHQELKNKTAPRSASTSAASAASAAKEEDCDDVQGLQVSKHSGRVTVDGGLSLESGLNSLLVSRIVTYESLVEKTKLASIQGAALYRKSRTWRARIHSFAHLTTLFVQLRLVTCSVIETLAKQAKQDEHRNAQQTDRIDFTWNQQRLLSMIPTRLNFLASCHELVEWYGTDFPFVSNPFMIAVPLTSRPSTPRSAYVKVRPFSHCTFVTSF